ncbi:MAG: PilN domain-containing protein [Patescibacteria group bacterium]
MEFASPTKAAKGKDDLVTFGERPGFDFGVLFCWLAIFAAIGATAYFWLASRNLAGTLAEKQQERNEIISEIASPTYADVEEKAAGFKAAVEKLSEAKTKSYPASTFLTQLYKRVTSDVEVSAISMKSDGTLAIDGKTSSYRSIADLSLALKSWSALKDVDIGTSAVSLSTEGKATASFSITAKIDKSVSPEAVSSTTKGVQ